MTFTKRNDFIDAVDEEIYIFYMIVDIAEHLFGKVLVDAFVYKSGIFYINSRDGYNSIHYKTISGTTYDFLEMSSESEDLDVMNIRLPSHSCINRIKESQYHNEYSLFKDDDCELDNYLTNGVFSITEEMYFQYSLVNSDEVPEYKDLSRYMDMLNMKTKYEVCIYHHNIPMFTYIDYNELYDTILDKLKV